MSEDYETISLVKNEVFVYKIPPLGSNRGHKYTFFFFFKLQIYTKPVPF